MCLIELLWVGFELTLYSFIKLVEPQATNLSLLLHVWHKFIEIKVQVTGAFKLI